MTLPNLEMTARMPTARSTDAAAARRKPDCEAVRLNYFLERKLVAALQQDPRYVIKRNVIIPTTPESRIVVRRANGGYIGMSLPSDGDVNLTTNVEMLVVDTTNGWAGAYCFRRRVSITARTAWPGEGAEGAGARTAIPFAQDGIGRGQNGDHRHY